MIVNANTKTSRYVMLKGVKKKLRTLTYSGGFYAGTREAIPYTVRRR